MIEFFLKGMFISSGLIIAIGGQNAFVLKQGLLRQHTFFICLTCFLCDALLISLGVMGLGGIIHTSLFVSKLLAAAGAIFLIAYGWRAFQNAYHSKSYLNVTDSEKNLTHITLKNTLLTTLAITLLNPHVYLDTVVILGSIAGTFNFYEKLFFLSGTLVTSSVWFFSLGYGARLLIPLFKKNRTWQILDVIIGCIMWWVATSLIIFIVKS